MARYQRYYHVGKSPQEHRCKNKEKKMTSFDQFNLPPALNANLLAMGYTTPTPIQKQAIPLGLSGSDILGSAQTGTGKTAAFSIPMITRIMSSPRGSALVLTPTRELATQVMAVVNQLLGKRSFIPTVLLIGGDSMSKQIAQLRMRPRIIVGTPGRINDHLERGNLILHDTSFLVLDETDRMLDMGFGIQIDKIIKFLPKERQTLMFSATIPPEIAKMSAKYLKSPERIAVGSTTEVKTSIQIDVIQVSEAGKYEELMTQLQKRENGSIIMFVKTKRGADRMSERLNKQGFKADTLHGDLHQRKREKVIQAFRDMKFRILVATDIAARGLDISHIEHVINYDLPQVPEDYIHRLGRTGRNGAEGAAVNLISPEDGLKWRDIHKLIYPGQPAPAIPHGASPQRGGGGYKGSKPNGGGYKGKSFGKGDGSSNFKPAREGAAPGGKPAGRNRFKRFSGPKKATSQAA